jgi:hypothetical protein
MDRIYATRFPLPSERTILTLSTRTFDVITIRALPISFGTPFRPLLTTISIAFRHVAKRIRDSGETVENTPAGAELAPCHRYDIGELDCRPSPSPIGIESAQQQTLERIWLRYCG